MKINKEFMTGFLLLMILFFSFLFRLPFINAPLEGDEAEIAYIAQRIQQGDIAYKDAVHQKTPGMFYVYLFIFKTIGNELNDIRLFTFLFVLLEIFLLYKLASMLFGRKTGLLSAAIFGLVTADVNLLGFMAKAEIFMLAPIIGSIILLLLGLRKKSGLLLFTCGILNGIAFLIKQTAVFNSMFIFVFLLFEFIRNEEKERFTELIKKYFYFICGFILTLLPVIIYFLIKDALGDFFYWTFLHNFDYVYSSPYKLLSKYTALRLFHQLKRMLNVGWIFWGIAVYAFYRFFKTKTIKDMLIIGWFIFMLLSTFPGSRFFPQYFLLLMPPLAIASGWGLNEIIKRINKINSPVAKKTTLIAVVSVILIGSLSYHFNYYFISSLSQIPILKHVYGNYTYAETGMKYIGNYINEHTSSEDTVLLFGPHLQIFFYANRKSATKYIIFFPVMHTSYKDALYKQKEIFQEITKNKPKYIIVNIGYSAHFDQRYIVDKIAELVANDYYLEGIVYEENNKPEYVFDAERVELFNEYESVRMKIFRRNGRSK